MATVTNTIKLPGGVTPSSAAVEIELVASTSTKAAGWVTATDVTILATYRPTVTSGAWSADLTPNADIDPSGTVYRINEYANGKRYTHYIEVGSGGGTVHDLLTDEPASVESAALTAHKNLGTGAHAASAISVADAAGVYSAANVETALAEVALTNIPAQSALTVTAGAVTVPATAGKSVTIALTADAAVTLADSTVNHRTLDVIFVQDATGGRTVTWETPVQWMRSTPTIGSLADAVTTIRLRWLDGGWVEDGTPGQVLTALRSDRSPLTLPTIFTLMSGQAHESPTVTNCTLTADTVNVKMGTQSHKLALAGAVTATCSLNPLTIGTQVGVKYTGLSVLMHVSDASKISSFTVQVYDQAGGASYQNFARSTETGAWGRSLSNGWNLVRDPAEYRRAVAGGATMSQVYGVRLVIVSNGAVDVSVQQIALECRPKATMLFIQDGAYVDFFDSARGYVDLKQRGIPVTIAPDCTSVGVTAGVITEARLAELAAENRNSVSFHGYSTLNMATATTAQCVGETVKAQQWLAARGYTGRVWRAAWLSNNCPNASASDSLVLANPSSGLSGYDMVHMWPFSNPNHVNRFVLHGRTTADIDWLFTALERSRGVGVMYTHRILDSGVVDMTTAEWDYFLGKVDEGLAEGWLEGGTFETLMESTNTDMARDLSGAWGLTAASHTDTTTRFLL